MIEFLSAIQYKCTCCTVYRSSINLLKIFTILYNRRPDLSKNCNPV